MEIDELIIIDRCRNGELEEFGRLYQAYVKKIYRYFFYRVRHEQLAEDLTAQTFTKALSGISGYSDAKGTFSAWLYGIGRNCLTDHMRSKKETVEFNDDVAVASGENQEKVLDAKLKLQEVEKFLSTLTPRQKELVVMRVWDGLSFKEIGEILNKSEAACKMAFGRVMAKLPVDSAFALFTAIYFYNRFI